MMVAKSINLLKNDLCLTWVVISAVILTTTAQSPPQTCEYGGNEYPVGTQTELDPCSTFICNEPDDYYLEESACRACDSELPPPPGECCPVCQDYCEYDGKRYELGTYNKVNDCSELYCDEYGESSLIVSSCPAVDCPMHKVEGVCCPVCDDE